MSTNVGSTSGSSQAGAGIRFSGLGSGIDTAGIVDALMRIERLPIDRIQRDKTRVERERGVVNEMNTLVNALRDKAAALYDPTALQGKSATTADDAVVKASASATAATGTYNVTVTALAQSHTMATGASPALNAGTTLDITVGGTTTSVAIQGGDTLQGLADRINQTSGTVASASVINDRLVLVSRTGGTAGTMTIGGTAALGLATTQAGQNAAATINGVAVTSSSNRIEGSVAGLSIDITGTGSTTVTVAADTGAIQGQVQAFIDAYNKLVTNMGNATRYDVATQTAGTLQGETAFTSFLGGLRNIAGSAVSGLGGGYDSLAQIGITSSRTGTLTLDAAKFNEALAKDPAAVRNVFGRDDGVTGAGAADGIARQIREFANDFSTNTIASRLTGYGTTVQRMNERITQLEDVMEVREQRLRAQFQAMESAIAQLQSQSASLAARLG